MNKYMMNWLRFTREYLPTIVRTNLVNLLYAFIRGIRSNHFRLKTHIQETDKTLTYNCQYPNLQRLLNDRFDNQSRRIKVYDDSSNEDFLIVYPEAELKPIVIGFEVVKPMRKYGVYMGFIVEIPADTDTDSEKKIRKTIDGYKFAGTTYNIIKI